MPTPAIKKLNAKHDTLIDLLIINPQYSNKELARELGITAQRVCQLKNDKNFKHSYQLTKTRQRKGLFEKLDTKRLVVADTVLDAVNQAAKSTLVITQNPDFLVKALDSLLPNNAPPSEVPQTVIHIGNSTAQSVGISGAERPVLDEAEIIEQEST